MQYLMRMLRTEALDEYITGVWPVPSTAWALHTNHTSNTPRHELTQLRAKAHMRSLVQATDLTAPERQPSHTYSAPAAINMRTIGSHDALIAKCSGVKPTAVRA